MTVEKRGLLDILGNDEIVDSTDWRKDKDGEDHLLAWISFANMDAFVAEVSYIFGEDFFTDGDVEVTVLRDCFCVDATEWFSGYFGLEGMLRWHSNQK